MTSKARTLKKQNILKIICFSLIVVIIFIALAFLLWNSYTNDQTTFEKQCVRHGPKGIHIHPNLKIVIDGINQEIPKNIGIKSFFCMRPIHTHDNSGLLHIESKIVRDFTLGNFFTIWNKPFTKSCIFDYCTDQGRLKMEVNGEENREFENYILRDKDQIRIEYKSERSEE